MNRPKAMAPDPEIDSPSTLPLVPSETRLKLGRVPPGTEKSCAFWLTNRSSEPVELAEISTSCGCLTVELPVRLLTPVQKVRGSVRLDLRHEPRFTGNLGISVRGTGKAAEAVFAFTVAVSVERD